MVNASPLPINDGERPTTTCSSSFSSFSNLLDVADPLGISSSARVQVAGFSQQLLDSPQRDAGRGDQLPHLIEQRLLGLLGEPLSDTDRVSVQQMPLRPCVAGEMVAVQDSDGVLRYGKVRDEELTSGEVKVQVSKSCIRWYAVSQIYFFQSVRKSGKNVDMWIENGDEADSPVGVIAEVNTLLARMNVSLSSSYEDLMTEILRLQQRTTLAEKARREAMKQVNLALRQKRDAEKALVCVVCLVNPVDRVLIPCGHSYCSTCVERLHRDSCPVCRLEITDSAAFRIS
ncbi:C3HC4 type (RING finger) zinc finger protein [Phytophthora infestans]|uniref:C3HC4 type (RING finger) zinc finger protein n=1 Tax=Phytophthora infestans TaxID=4787 RepID=A0A833T8U8_PHYIN|nr:C3HC4 type (RING finger) zinc finger protein [Phytophthora infestans]KAF4128455.1 C3HC4 type zinc finger [Phytophthora infestans]